MGEKGDLLGNMQKTKIWPYEQVVHAQPRIRPAWWDTQTSEILRYKEIT